jgi:hypothetical protein
MACFAMVPLAWLGSVAAMAATGADQGSFATTASHLPSRLTAIRVRLRRP